jgi:acyl carrier protein
MTTEEIVAQLNPVFKNVMDNDDIVVTLQTIASDIEEWDSLTHIQLIVAIEKHFKIRFNSSEIISFKNVGDMVNSIRLKLGATA